MVWGEQSRGGMKGMAMEAVGEHDTNYVEVDPSGRYGRMYLNLQTRENTKLGGSKNKSAFLKIATTTLLHTSGESEKMYLNLQTRENTKLGGSNNKSAFLKIATTTLLHTTGESEKVAFVGHINSYLRDDPVMKRYLPIDPMTNDLFDIVKDGILLCKILNVATPGTIDD